jgi:hypothetical protein
MQSLLVELVAIKKQISDLGACQHPCDEVADRLSQLSDDLSALRNICGQVDISVS